MFVIGEDLLQQEAFAPEDVYIIPSYYTLESCSSDWGSVDTTVPPCAYSKKLIWP